MRFSDMVGQKIVIWGGGREASAVIRAAKRLGLDLDFTVVDENATVDTLEGVKVVAGDAATEAFEAAEIVVRSPGVSRYRPEFDGFRMRGVNVTTATNLWFAEEHGPVIAVTGTKGKSTTSSVAAHVLNALGTNTYIAGNIGRSPVDYLGEPEPERWVLELSSFQASDLEHSPDVGILTSLSPEHLDWHGDATNYFADKLNLFANNPDIIVVVNGYDEGARSVMDRLEHVVVSGEPSGIHVDGEWFMTGETRMFPTSTLRLNGIHNRQLVCASLTALQQSGIDVVGRADEVAAALATFEALPHRLNSIAEHAGVTYVDDGLATTPVATIAALAAFADREITLLAGGHDRGLSYDELGRAIAHAPMPVRVLTMPDNGPRVGDAIQAQLDAVGATNASVTQVSGLDEAVEIAVQTTTPGGVVLLSPGAASFGHFHDYADRSRAYAAAIDRFTSKHA